MQINIKNGDVSLVGFVHSFSRHLLSTYCVQDIEQHFRVSKTDVVLLSWILPSWRRDRHLTGDSQCAECYDMDALCLRQEGEKQNHIFWCPLHSSNQKNAAISLDTHLYKFNFRGKNTAVAFPNWNSPPCVFGKHRCLGVFPLTITEIVHNYEWFWLTSAPTKPWIIS